MTTASFVDVHGDLHTLGLTPEQASITAATWNFATIARQGLKPLAYRQDKTPRKLSFSHNIVDTVGGSINVESILNDLIHVAEAGSRIRIRGMGLLEVHGWWNIKSHSVTINQRRPDQHPNDVTMSWSLEEWVPDSAVKIGRVKTAGSGSTAAKKYTVKAGDTWYSIAQSQMGDSSYWPFLSSYNNVADATVPPNPGSVIAIPATAATSTASFGPGSSTYSSQVPSAASAPGVGDVGYQKI